jgi:hypothetical protein
MLVGSTPTSASMTRIDLCAIKDDRPTTAGVEKYRVIRNIPRS